MKVLEYIQSLIVPTHMVKRKKMNVFISILIFVLSTYLLSVPISSFLSKERYNTFDSNLNFNVFNYVDDNNSLNAITDAEKEKYNMITFSEFKALNTIISVDGVEQTENIENGKEYVLKSMVPVKDKEGTISKYETYYIHVVFDLEEESKYDITEKFDKLSNDDDGKFRHFLLVFYTDGFIYRSTYEISNSYTSNKVTYYKKCMIEFEEITSMTDVSHKLEDMLLPLYKYQYKLRAFLFVFLFPAIMSLIFSLVLRKSGQICGMKEYFNIAAVSTIPFMILCFAFSFISVSFCNIIFQSYSILYVIYYFVIVVVINRKPRIN